MTTVRRPWRWLALAPALVAATALTGCLVPPGWPGLEDGGIEDGQRLDRRGNDDVGQRIDAGLSSDRGFTCPFGMQCTSGVGCTCCGSAGPQPICLCSNRCNDDLDCQQPGLRYCNKPDPGSPGVCTAPGFNCCWQCQ
jgi:hypothetical protein